MMKRRGTLADLVGHIRWYVKLRWVYIFSLAISWLGGYLIFIGWDKTILRDVYLMLFGLAINAVFMIMARHNTKNIMYYYRLALGMLATDVVTASIVLYDHGGLEARTIILYGIP